MKPARARNTLLAAIALSLLLHLVLAGYAPWPIPRIPAQTETLSLVRTIRIAKRTPPPRVATPRPTVRTFHRSSVRPRITPPRITGHGAKSAPSRAAASPTPAASPSARPSPSPTAAPLGCLRPAQAPAVAAMPSPVLDPVLRASRANGIVTVAVTLAPDGRVLADAIAQSSGNSGLDGAALQIASAARYTPKVVACKAVAGSYLFRVKFIAW